MLDIWGERLSILRVLDHLLRNAFQHNADEPHRRVWLRVRLEDEDGLLFEVGDSGQGIPMKARTSLFQFGFGVNSTGQMKGHGLGLWSCTRLAEAQGGRIWMETAVGAGTRFFLTLSATMLT